MNAGNAEDIDEVVDRIGNLTLLEKGKNRGLGNAGFKEKKEAGYATSGLALNKSISEYLDWTTKTIETRSHSLAKVARDVWRADY